MNFTRYTQDEQYRASMQQYRVAVHIGSNGPAYEYRVDGKSSIIRHNKQGGYTHIR